MSKSLGNMIEPEAIIQQSGAEVLRLWVAMVDYREEIRIGKEILARVVEAYRKIRNTLRILTANLFDFDPQCDQVAVADLKDVDRYAVARFGECTERVLSHYDRYEFPAISHALSDFLTVDVSAFYVDVSKDCLYTYAARSPERRSAQTAIYLIADGLARLFAPLLPVTADELWHHLPGDRDESVHLAEFPTELSALADRELIARWRRLLAIRDAVNIEVEQRRQEKTVGTSLEARVSLLASGATAALLEGCRDELPTLFITSAVNLVIDETVQAGDAATSGSIWSEPDGALAIEVDRVGGHKCERCWRYVPSLSQESGREGLCARCVDVLSEAVGVDESGVAPEKSPSLGARRRLLLILIASLTVVLDQVAKVLVRSALPLHESIVVIPGVLDFTHVRNTGAAFGLLNAVDLSFKLAILTAIALTALAAIGLYAARTTSRDWPSLFGLTLVIGGAVGNLIDRVTTGYVLDFIDVYWRGWHFWVFNVADAAISVGAALLVLDMLLGHRHVSETV